MVYPHKWSPISYTGRTQDSESTPVKDRYSIPLNHATNREMHTAVMLWTRIRLSVCLSRSCLRAIDRTVALEFSYSKGRGEIPIVTPTAPSTRRLEKFASHTATVAATEKSLRRWQVCGRSVDRRIGGSASPFDPSPAHRCQQTNVSAY